VMIVKKASDQFPVAYIAVHKSITTIGRYALEVAKVACVGQFVQVNNRRSLLLDPLQNEVRPDETRAPSHQKRVFHKNSGLP